MLYPLVDKDRSWVSYLSPLSRQAQILYFKDYCLEPVYRTITKEQRTEIVDFWRHQRAVIDPSEARRRSREVVFMVRDAAGELAGVCTAGLIHPRPEEQPYYAYRMFLRQQDRVPHLMRIVTNTTRDFLRNFHDPEVTPQGMLIVTENPKLMRPGIKKYFERHGYHYRGKTRRGLDIWAVEFGIEGLAGSD